ncbi:MAG: type II secretion system F family protein [Burkholderiaceae bacterium]|nr:MAG: type II secretion system F family protein [Burkholderiaceae bacterium]
MPSFAYKGRNSSSGALVQGELDSASEEAVANVLIGRGVIPLEIVARGASGGALKIKWGGDKIRTEDVMLFSRQMHTLLKAGVPIMRALGGLQESTVNPGMTRTLREVRESLDSGRELSAALARHPKVFTPFYIAMMKVGELTGQMDEIFMRLFDHLEFEKFMHDQVKSALRYPIFVSVVMIAALVVINLFVIPAFAKVYKAAGAELPLITRLLVGFSDFMVATWPVLLLLTIGGVWLFRGWTKTAAGQLQWDAIKLRIPIAGKIVLKATLARFSRSLALALKSGVPIVQALNVTAQTVGNHHVARCVDRMREGVERGESVLRTAHGTHVFTPVVLQMIAVGEESGALDDLLGEIAEMYQREVEYELKTLSAQIEPIMIVCLGILVLIVALGVFLPIWDLGKTMIK